MINRKIVRVLSVALVSAMLMVSFSSAAAKSTCKVGQNPIPWSQYVPLVDGSNKEKRKHKRAWKKINICKVRCKHTPEHAICLLASIH